jgi:hypothetical protein
MRSWSEIAKDTVCRKSRGSNDTVVGIDLATLMTKSVSGLTPAKKHYWKVVVDDDKSALVKREIRSFTTQ